MASRLFEKMLRKLKGAYNHYIENGIAAPSGVERYLLLLAKLLIRVKRPMVIGITGSVGKTTTASMIAHLLGSVECQPFVGRVLCTVDNMNNHDGLALTVLGIPRWQRSTGQRLLLYVRAPLQTLVKLVSRRFPKVLVLEYGTDRSGYLGPMVRAVPPNIAVITTIGHAHLAGMGGDLRGVLEEKATLLTALRSPELVLLGSEHPYVDELARRTSSRTIFVSGAGTVSAQKFAQEVARFLGVPEDVIRSVRTELSLERRFQHTCMGSYSVIDDSFNANPTSVTFALEQLAAIQWPGRKIAVLGSMAELGSLSTALHEQIGALAQEKVKMLVSVGEAALHFHADTHFESSTACAASIHTLIEVGDLILVKGSASAKMDLIVQRLLAEDLICGRTAC